MVNYCCVQGCGRNSRKSKQLYYYSTPKDKKRRDTWFTAAGRQDLIALTNSADKYTSYRICSRHFTPASIKNKHLCEDAVPTLFLPGSNTEEITYKSDVVSCNNCQVFIAGLRYKCITCIDFDLCHKCEMSEIHSEHYMLRVPHTKKFAQVATMLKKWRKLSEECTSDSSDDEPITKYARNYDSGLDLSEELKTRLRKEVKRVLNINNNNVSEKSKDKNNTNGEKRGSTTSERPAKKQKTNADIEEDDNSFKLQEVAFADVNELSWQPVMESVKTENLEYDAHQPNDEPMMHIKLTEEIPGSLMVEVNNQFSIHTHTVKPTSPSTVWTEL